MATVKRRKRLRGDDNIDKGIQADFHSGTIPEGDNLEDVVEEEKVIKKKTKISNNTEVTSTMNQETTEVKYILDEIEESENEEKSEDPIKESLEGEEKQKTEPSNGIKTETVEDFTIKSTDLKIESTFQNEKIDIIEEDEEEPQMIDESSESMPEESIESMPEESSESMPEEKLPSAPSLTVPSITNLEKATPIHKSSSAVSLLSSNDKSSKNSKKRSLFNFKSKKKSSKAGK